MADETVRILIQGEDRLTAPTRTASSALTGLQKAAGVATTGLGRVESASSSAGSAFGKLVGTLSTVGFAVMGLQQLAGAVRGVGDAIGVGLNSQLEQATAKFNAFTKDVRVSQAMIADLRREADITPFDTQEMIKTGAALLNVAGNANKSLMETVRIAELLAATNPMQGLEGAAYALREALGGDFLSLIERFDIPRGLINKLKAEGLPNIEIVSRALKSMGYDMDLVTKMGETLEGRWSTFTSTLDTLRQQASVPIFEALKGQLVGMQGWLDANKDAIQDWVARVAAGFSLVIDGVGAMASGFANGLGAILDIVLSVGQAIYEALQWLNPFAEHSPSLVAQVERGVFKIEAAFSDLAPAASEAANRLGSAMEEFVVNTTGPLDSLKERLHEAEAALRRFTTGPIKGSKEFSDRLNKIEDEAAKVELAMARLRASGQDKRQIWKNGKAVEETSDAYRELEGQLRKLRNEADVVRLEERVQLDPLRRQLKEMAQDQVELPFEDMARGARKAKAEVDALTPAVAALEKAKKAAGGGGGGAGVGGAAAAGGGIAKVIEEYKQKAAEAEKAAAQWAQKVADYKKQVQDAMQPIADFWARVFGKDVAAGTETINGVTTVVSKHIDGVVDSIRKAFSEKGLVGLAQLAQDALAAEWAKIDWSKVWTRVTITATTIWEWFTNGVQALTDWAKGVWIGIDWSKVWTRVTITAQSVAQWFDNAAKALTDWIRMRWAEIDWQSTWAAVALTADTVGKWFVNSVPAIEAWIREQWNQINWQQFVPPKVQTPEGGFDPRKAVGEARSWDAQMAEALRKSFTPKPFEDVGAWIGKAIVDGVVWFFSGGLKRAVDSLTDGLIGLIAVVPWQTIIQTELNKWQAFAAGVNSMVNTIMTESGASGMLTELSKIVRRVGTSAEDSLFGIKGFGLTWQEQVARLDNATNAIGRLSQALAILAIRKAAARGDFDPAGSGLENNPYTGRAAGGPVRAGTPYLVGEKGRELFVPKTAGVIVPHGAFRTAADGAGWQPSVAPARNTVSITFGDIIVGSGASAGDVRREVEGGVVNALRAYGLGAT